MIFSLLSILVRDKPITVFSPCMCPLEPPAPPYPSLHLTPSPNQTKRQSLNHPETIMTPLRAYQKRQNTLRNYGRDFRGGPVAKIPHFQRRGVGPLPGLGTRSHMPQLRLHTAKKIIIIFFRKTNKNPTNCLTPKWPILGLLW